MKCSRCKCVFGFFNFMKEKPDAFLCPVCGAAIVGSAFSRDLIEQMICVLLEECVETANEIHEADHRFVCANDVHFPPCHIANEGPCHICDPDTCSVCGKDRDDAIHDPSSRDHFFEETTAAHQNCIEAQNDDS